MIVGLAGQDGVIYGGVGAGGDRLIDKDPRAQRFQLDGSGQVSIPLAGANNYDFLAGFADDSANNHEIKRFNSTDTDNLNLRSSIGALDANTWIVVLYFPQS